MTFRYVSIRYVSMTSSVAVLILALGAFGRAQQAPALDTSPQVLDVQGGQVRVVTVAPELFHPCSFAFLPDGDILVAERNGRLQGGAAR